MALAFEASPRVMEWGHLVDENFEKREGILAMWSKVPESNIQDLPSIQWEYHNVINLLLAFSRLLDFGFGIISLTKTMTLPGWLLFDQCQLGFFSLMLIRITFFVLLEYFLYTSIISCSILIKVLSVNVGETIFLHIWIIIFFQSMFAMIIFLSPKWFF